MDFVLDLVEKIRSQGVTFFVVTLHSGKDKPVLNTFHNISGPESLETLEKVLAEIEKKIAEHKKKKKK